MHILAFSPRYYPAAGGAESYLTALAEHWVKAGHQVTVITTDAHDFQLFWDNTAKRVDPQTATHVNGVDILRFPVEYLTFAPLSYHAWRRGLWLLSRFPIPLPRLMGWLARQTPRVPALWQWVKTADISADIIFGFNICYEPILDAGKQLAKRLNLPFVACPFTHLGAGERPGGDAQSGFYTMRHQASLIKSADALLMQTAAERSFYIAQGANPTATHLASAGIDPAQYVAGDGARWRQKNKVSAPIIAYIGTHDYDKGTPHLIEAVQALWANDIECELVLAGSQTSQFKAYIKQLLPDVRQRIHLLGRIDEATKQDLLAATDIFAMPSRIDSFGIVFLEAWLYGKPVIGSQAWGMSDVIEDGRDGVLVPFGDALALSWAIQVLLADPELRQQMGDHGRTKTLTQHTWAQKQEAVSAVLDHLLNA